MWGRTWGVCLLAGCAATAPSARGATPRQSAGEESVRIETGPTTPASAPADRAVPAFVVYTAEHSTIVPLDGSEPTHANGVWVLDDGAEGPRVLHAMDDAPTAGECTFPALRPCAPDEWVVESFEADGLRTYRSFSRDACPCFGEPHDDDDDDREEHDECDDLHASESTVVSLAGGVLYALGGTLDNEGCGGAHVVDSTGWSLSLTQREPRTRAVGGACFSRLLDTVGDPERVLADAACAPARDADASADEGDDEGIEDDACSTCADRAGDEAAARYVRRGRLLSVGTNASTFWELTYVESVPATPTDCPGPNDPCGDPSAFADIASADEYWISTDGSAALFARGGVTSVWPAGRSPHGVAVDLAAVIGVRFHADVRPLLAQIEEGDDDGSGPEPPALAEADRDFVDTHAGRDWGNRCFEHLRAGALDAATAACARGLEQARDPTVLGALLYNLGRIAEARGHHPREAIGLYEESLAQRPGNVTVEERLRALQR